MFTKRKKMRSEGFIAIAAVFVVLLNVGYVLSQDNQNYFFGQSGQGRFVPSFQSTRSNFFSPSTGSFQSFRNAQHNGSPGSYQEQTLFIGEDGTTPQDTSSPFVPFPPYQSTRSPDYYELSPRPFGAGAASSSSFSRPQSVRPNGGNGFVPQKSAGRSNVPHQQSQFLAHFNEQTHLPGVPTEKTTTQSSRVGRPFGSGFSRNRPVGSSLNRQPTEDLYPSQQQLPFRNSRNRFQPSAERTTSTTTTSTSTASPEKTSRYNRFGSGRSVQTSKAPTVQSVSSTTTSTRSKLNKNIFQPRRPVFISREVNEPVHLKSRVFPSKITINHNGSNNDAEEDEETLQEEINETDHVQEKPVTENVKDIPVEEFEKLGLHEPVQNATIQNALNASGNGDGQPVIITSNFFLPQDNAEQQEEQQEEQPQQEQQQQETQKEEQKQQHEQQQEDEESEGERTSEEELSTTQRPDYEYEYEDYEEKSTTLPTPAEEIATVKEVHPDQETTATEEDKKETNSDGNNEEVTNSSETAPEGTTAEQSGSEEGSAEYEDDELLDDEEDEEGEFEEGSEEASPEEVQEQPKQDQNSEDIVGKAVVQVITTKSVVNGSTAVPQSISSTTSSGDMEYKENNKPPALEPNKNAEGSPAEDESVNNATESYVVVASIQTSRSISGARFLPFPVVEQEEKKQTLSELERKIHEQKSIVRPTKKSAASDPESESTENILPKEQPQETTTEISIITTTDAIPETTTEKSVTNQSISTESIIDKLDRVQSELSSGLLSGKFPILNEMPELEIPTTSTTTTTSAPRFVPNFRKYGKTTTSKPEKSRIDIESIPMDDLSGLLPPGFKPRQNSYRNRKITTTRSTTTTTTTTTAAPRAHAENTVHKPSRNYTIGRSFKNTPLSSQDVTLAGLLPKGFKANTSVTEAPATQKNLKDLLSKIKFEDNLDKLLPQDYREKAPKTTTGKPSLTVVDDISKFLPPGFKPLPLNTTEKSFPAIPIKDHNTHLPHPGLKGPSTTTKKPPISVVPISDDLSKFLPPGFKLDPSKNDDSGPIDISKLLPKDFKSGGEEKPEDIIIKKIELKDVSSLLPSGYKENLTREEEPASSTEKTDSGLKIVFPKGINKRPGVRLTTPKSSGADGPAPPAIVIKKGPPTRATTEFTGWPTPSTTPFSIEKLLEEQKAAPIDISELLSSSTTTTTTTTTTTMEPPKPTEPGHCRSECDLAGTIKIVDGVKWKPELLDHNTDEWKNLAREVEAQLNEVYSNAPHLSKWYKKVRIDSFNKGSVLVDYFVELSNISRNVDTLEIKRLFHEALVTAPLPVVPLHETNETRDSSEREEKLVKETLLLGRFVVDPVSTDFIVIPKPLSPTVEFAEEDVLIPQWAIVVIVIGVGSLCFVVIFGVTVLVNRQKRAKKTPTPLTNDMLHELDKNHMGGIENYGVDEFYNVDDTWGDTKQPIKPKRFTNSMHGSSASNIYDSWRSQRGGDYYYDNHNYTPHKIDPYPPDAFADAHQMYTYNPRTRYHRDYDPDF